jgi:hypothetical protein
MQYNVDCILDMKQAGSCHNTQSYCFTSTLVLIVNVIHELAHGPFKMGIKAAIRTFANVADKGKSATHALIAHRYHAYVHCSPYTRKV